MTLNINSNPKVNPSSNDSHWYRLHPQTDGSLSTQGDSKRANQATVSLDNRGLAYADGFFSTMAVVAGKIVWADYHWRRVESHAQALQLALPKNNLSLRLGQYAEQLQQGVMKVIVTRAPQDLRGYGFSADSAGSACEIWLKSTAMAIDGPATIALPDGRALITQAPIQAICLSSQLACLPATLAGLKSLNRLDNVLASGELLRLNSIDSAQKQQGTGCGDNKSLGEGLVRDMTGHWVEGTMSNVFYQLSAANPNDSSKNNIDTNYLTSGQWFTPSMSQSGVNGVMRQVIIDGLSKTSCPVIIRALTDDDLPKLSQLFFCNAVRGIIPVTSLTLLSGEVVGFSI